MISESFFLDLILLISLLSYICGYDSENFFLDLILLVSLLSYIYIYI